MKTAGSEALAAKVAKHGEMTKLADELGVLPNMVSRWASGDRTPRMPMLARLEKELEIPVRAWGEPPGWTPELHESPSSTGTDDA